MLQDEGGCGISVIFFLFAMRVEGVGDVWCALGALLSFGFIALQ